MQFNDLSLKRIANYKEFEQYLLKHEDNYDANKIAKAYIFAEKAHRTQKRASGEPYIIHPLNVAMLCMRIGLDTDSIVSAFLHDTVEDTGINLNQLEKEFGIDVALLVDGLTVIKKYATKYNENEEQITDYKRLLMTTTSDIRVLIIKLCDKVHNMQTIEYLEEDKKLAYANEVKYVYAPLADYLGFQALKNYLSDSAFKIIDSKNYNKCRSIIDNDLKKNKTVLEKFKKNIIGELELFNVNIYDVAIRVKTATSFFYKLRRKNNGVVDYSKIYLVKDVLAARLIVDTVEECYLALGVINSKYKYIEEEFDDYIAEPKASGYMSIHTTIYFQDTLIEVQIRTALMHDYNEYGIASRVSYKENSTTAISKEEISQKVGKSNYGWVRDLITWQQTKNFKITLFQDSVFVFTPKHTVFALKEGSTPVDFAFRVHSEVGRQMKGAKVNGKLVQFGYKLKTGDICEILIDKKKTSISRDWLHYAKLTSTKTFIRRILNEN